MEDTIIKILDMKKTQDYIIKNINPKHYTQIISLLVLDGRECTEAELLLTDLNNIIVNLKRDKDGK